MYDFLFSTLFCCYFWPQGIVLYWCFCALRWLQIAGFSSIPFRMYKGMKKNRGAHPPDIVQVLRSLSSLCSFHPVLIKSMWQLNWATEHPGIWLNIIWLCLWRCFCRKLKFKSATWGKQVALPQCGTFCALFFLLGTAGLIQRQDHSGHEVHHMLFFTTHSGMYFFWKKIS